MIAEQIRGSLDVGPGAGMGLPASPPLPSCSVGLPPEPPPPWDGHGDSLCMCSSLHLEHYWFPFCLLAFLVHFKPRVGFISSPATVSGFLGKMRWDQAGEQWVV